MSLEHVLLGMLKEPASGYDLKLQFERGAKFFWSAEFGQIYGVLKRMVEKGWLKCASKPSTKGPNRNVYRRTRAGTSELHRWLQSGPTVGTERHAYIAQIIFLGELGDSEYSIAFVSNLREELVGARDVVADSEKSHRLRLRENPQDAELLHAHLATLLGLETLEAKIHWCDTAIKRMKKLADRQPEEP